eukprot:4332243-Amphidinium_carterae.1
MAYMQHLGVWTYSTTEECFTATGRKPYGVRWVDSDKSPILRHQICALDWLSRRLEVTALYSRGRRHVNLCSYTSS